MERGWKGMRQLALSLSERGYWVDLVLRESVSKDVLRIITPKERVKIISTDKKIFSFYLVIHILRMGLQGAVRWIVLNRNERAQKLSWVGLLIGAKIAVLEESGNGYQLLQDGRVIEKLM